MHSPHSLVLCGNKTGLFWSIGQVNVFPRMMNQSANLIIHGQTSCDNVVMTKDTEVIQGLQIDGDQ